MNLQEVDHYLCQECTVVQTKLLENKNISVLIVFEIKSADLNDGTL